MSLRNSPNHSDSQRFEWEGVEPEVERIIADISDQSQDSVRAVSSLEYPHANVVEEGPSEHRIASSQFSDTSL